MTDDGPLGVRAANTSLRQVDPSLHGTGYRVIYREITHDPETGYYDQNAEQDGDNYSFIQCIPPWQR